MLTLILIVLIVLWLAGAFGGTRFGIEGNWIHALLVIVLILVVLRLLGVL